MEQQRPRRSADRERVDVLAQLALEERQRFGPVCGDDVTLDPHPHPGSIAPRPAASSPTVVR
jgi:hypothetical protein